MGHIKILPAKLRSASTSSHDLYHDLCRDPGRDLRPRDPAGGRLVAELVGRTAQHTCPEGQVLNEIKSEHKNSKEDRRWDVRCGDLDGGLVADQGCIQSGFVNSWDKPMFFRAC